MLNAHIQTRLHSGNTLVYSRQQGFALRRRKGSVGSSLVLAAWSRLCCVHFAAERTGMHILLKGRHGMAAKLLGAQKTVFPGTQGRNMSLIDMGIDMLLMANSNRIFALFKIPS